MDFKTSGTKGKKIGENKRKPDWNRANHDDIINYKNMLGDRLEMVEKGDGMKCNDIDCNNESHIQDIDSNVLDVLTGIVESSYCCIPIKGIDERIPRKKRGKLHNFDEEVKPYRTLESISCI